MHVPKITEELKSLALTYLKAKAYADTIRPVVVGYEKEVLARHNFTIAPRWLKYEGRRKREPRVILDPKDTYLLRDEDAKIYFEEVHEEHIKHGFKVKKDYCPLLIAENNARKVLKAFCEASYYLVKNVMSRDKFDDLLCCVYGVDKYDRYANLTLKLVVPTIKKKELS